MLISFSAPLNMLLKGKHGNSMTQGKKVPGAVNGTFLKSYRAGKCLNFYQPKLKEELLLNNSYTQ